MSALDGRNGASPAHAAQDESAGGRNGRDHDERRQRWHDHEQRRREWQQRCGHRESFAGGRSLRWKLTWVLIKTVLLAWFVWLACQVWQLSREHSGMLDNSLREIAEQVLASMPEGLERLPSRDPKRATEPVAADRKMSFQVWAQGRNVVYSAAAPLQPLNPTFKDGFARRLIGGEPWQVYTLTDHRRGLIVQVGRSKQMAIQELQGWIAGSLLAAGLILMLFGLATWKVIGRSLRPITALREILQQRPPLDLTPLPTQALPSEFRPLVDAFNNQLERVDAAVQHERRFISDAAHELRTPLAVLSTHAELALRATTLEEKNAALVRLNAGVQRSARLSEQLLDLARLDAGEESVRLKPLDLSDLIVLVIRDFETLARERRQRISLRAEPARLLGDVDQLGILLRNLIDNAVRHAGAEGQVAVTCAVHSSGAVVLSVADSGCGVSPEDCDRIFDRFYRAPGSPDGGSGIGLSLVARIAQTHGARIECGPGLERASDDPRGPGRGFEVRVQFPLAPAG
ncbi:ATP-binding protein [Lysobacter gummosus]|jgi:two-component system OmpR family sensor kinase|uniref:histidine kinase n=1 Tax=Lysobacter gummosus TaxID=262324 RepID=A0ABY3XEG9_9GAMM|nr:ATP-binding protein [Lysobacter gummosus]ALN89037.1 his Kinase A domain protein [Lysobacter gummosus]UNP29750.1 ATP-binding protein [Lysobacter gummosus]